MDLRCSRHTLAASIAALTLAGCGASPQSPTGTSAMIPQAAAHPAHVDYLYFVRKPDHLHNYFTASVTDFDQYLATHGYK